MNDLFDEQEAFEERAAIIEYDGKQSRAEAEAAARKEVEQEKFRSMVRQLLKWRAAGKVAMARDWLAAQNEATKALYRDAANDQWSRGSIGAAGVWL